MKSRFGRNIHCQECGRDDRIEVEWNGKFRYHYECSRCGVRVRETDRGKKREEEGEKNDG
ncbi:hypothetical protein AKJ62_01380 [candidate division MSBL1 archaeon SCGC-AAA259D14]|uniref:Uncharacterized protein n=1 Tax=candidate division MSBL1 archaeon SCGC-AAA259D14 TaxID=1698261 RepID=A0A133U7Q6_9EURY|nr:hypothetical protein AKJ62_01380 [candidate division MSBL1 archaeon SCGC-AAA259D14]